MHFAYKRALFLRIQIERPHTCFLRGVCLLVELIEAERLKGKGDEMIEKY